MSGGVHQQQEEVGSIPTPRTILLQHTTNRPRRNILSTYDGDNGERQAVKTIQQHGNTVSGKGIYLKAVRMAEGDMPAVVSAGLRLWGAIDFLTKTKGYIINYEVAGEKKK